MRLACWVGDHLENIVANKMLSLSLQIDSPFREKARFQVIVQLCKSCGFHGLHCFLVTAHAMPAIFP